MSVDTIEIEPGYYNAGQAAKLLRVSISSISELADWRKQLEAVTVMERGKDNRPRKTLAISAAALIDYDTRRRQPSRTDWEGCMRLERRRALPRLILRGEAE